MASGLSFAGTIALAVAPVRENHGLIPLPSSDALVPAQNGFTCMATPAAWLDAFRRQHVRRHHVPEHSSLRYRPARRPRSSNATVAPLIPRQVLQMSKNATRELHGPNAEWMASWWTQNPDWEYFLLDDADCADFVARFASPREQLAYARVAYGAQRADLSRYILLRELGGVYADTDAELFRPLALFVPSNASMMTPDVFSSDFMAYSPRHPFLTQTVDEVVQRVNNETERQAASAGASHCKDQHSCVIRITGPIAYSMAMVGAARRFCKTGSSSGAHPTPAACARSDDKAARAMHICPRKPGPPKLGWYCDAVQHWDCRNTAARRSCGASHYSNGGKFFRLQATAADALGPALRAAEACRRPSVEPTA